MNELAKILKGLLAADKIVGCVFCFAFYGGQLFGQHSDLIVDGLVLDATTKESIPGASVRIPDSDLFAITDSHGKFSITGIDSNVTRLAVSCFGYCDSTCPVNCPEGLSSINKSKQPVKIYLNPSSTKLGSVIVEGGFQSEGGTKSIAQITMSKAQISSDPTRSLATLLEGESGIAIASHGVSIQRPIIHGLSGNRILILNNGLKHGFQNWGSDHAPEIYLSTAEEISVIKGAAGVRYGAEALGGAIVVRPNILPLDNPLYARVKTGYQSNGKGYFANMSTGLGGKYISYFLNAGYVKIGDRNASKCLLTNSGKEERSASFGVRFNRGKWNAEVYYSLVDQNLAILRSSIAESGTAFVKAVNSDEPYFIRPFSYDINEPNQLLCHHTGKGKLSWHYASDAKVSFTVGRQLNQRQEYDVRRNEDKPILDLDLITTEYQLEWKHPSWLGLSGVIGGQIFEQDNDNNPGTGTTPLIPNYNTYRRSAFLVESWQGGANTWELGIRIDNEWNSARGRKTNQDIFRDEYEFTNVTASIGMLRELSETTTFRSNLGTAWRSPNMAELFSFGQHGFKTSFGLLRYQIHQDKGLTTSRVLRMSESGVGPEKGYKFVNEFSTNNSGNQYSVAAYAHYIENYIFERPFAVLGTIRGPMPAFIFDQTNAAFVGLDLTWERNWSKYFESTLGGSYLWSRNIRDDEPLIGQPPIRINSDVSCKIEKIGPFKEGKFSVSPSYTFRQFQAPRTIRPEELIEGEVKVTKDSEIFDFKDAPDDYFLLDASWSFGWKDFTSSVTVRNVLNSSYRSYLNDTRYFADEVGRNFLFTVGYTFNNK